MSQKATWVREYSADEIVRVREALRSPAGGEIRETAALLEIREAAEIYQGAPCHSDGPDAKESEDRMRRVAAAIPTFVEFFTSLKDLDDRTADVVTAWEVGAPRKKGQPAEVPVPWWQIKEIRRLLRSLPLDRLADSLEREANRSQPTGRPRKVERKWFVEQLADIWERVHGNPPPKSHQSGPFPRFVVACLEPIAPSECRGIEEVIREVTSKQGGN
jgi:hypothetical protein